jgi:hypothetical protein
LGNAPETYQIQGLVTGASGATFTSFSVTDSHGVTTPLVSINPTSATPGATWTPPVIDGFNEGDYTINMKATVGGNPFSTNTAAVNFSILQ